jgi:hypothetical protein
MAKGRKPKDRGGRASKSATAAPVERKPSAPREDLPEKPPLVPNPPQRNLPLLVVSVVLLVLWLGALVWMAAVS